MIDLSKYQSASPQRHSVEADLGSSWLKDAAVAIDAPPDADCDPRPEATWAPDAKRSGVCGAVSPRVIALTGGGYRMYYTQLLPRPGYPDGANDYDYCSARILSAFSKDGNHWTPEAGVRLSSQAGGAGDFRVVSSEVVPIGDGGTFRMYFECCTGPQSSTNSIRSAFSSDGLEWMLEPGMRLEAEGHNFSAPRLVSLIGGRCRLYCYDRGHGIVSAVSNDCGLSFQLEPGLRIAQDGESDACAAFAPEIVEIAGGGYRMFYAGYSQSNRAQILGAVSNDGLNWSKDSAPVISPGPGGWDAVKCSEMCLIRLPQQPGGPLRFRMFYEACDGTAKNQRGVWRIASATWTARPGQLIQQWR